MFFPFYILNQLKLGSNNFFLSELFPEYPSIFFPNILVGAQKCLRYRFFYANCLFKDGTVLFYWWDPSIYWLDCSLYWWDHSFIDRTIVILMGPFFLLTGLLFILTSILFEGLFLTDGTRQFCVSEEKVPIGKNKCTVS